jgi:2'-5' RNA ligase
MRLFAAIGIPEEIGDSLAALMGGLPGADWVDPPSYHITLRFIGEVGRAHAEEIDAELAEISARPFDLSLAGIDFFHTGGRPRTLWARVEPSRALAGLARKVDRAVVHTDLPPEDRAFTPHVTLARLRDVAMPKLMEFVQANALLRLPPFGVDHFTLFESRQGGGGPVYHKLADYPLTNAGAEAADLS